jgi:hypothetical protein
MPEDLLLISQSADAPSKVVERLGENSAAVIQRIAHDAKVRSEASRTVEVCPTCHDECLTAQLSTN